MKKHKKALLILSVIIIILGISGFAVYQVLVNYVFRSVMETEINQMLDKGDITLDQLARESDTSKNEAQNSNEKSEQIENDANTKADSDKSQKNSKTQTKSASERKKIVKAKAAEIEKMTSQQQRAAVIKMIKSRLSSADIKYLTGLLKDGLTPAEKSAAKKLALQRFSKEEINLIQNYYYKFAGMIE